MKILELEITKIRGIKYLKLTPNGGNMVIWGPNGTGKSAVVDAVDFLLTGRIARLIGEGTKGIKLEAHGPHVDHKPHEAIVSAVVQIEGYDKPVQITRKVSDPSTLIYPKEAKVALLPVLELASKGQHVLSRREILRYVTSEAGKRATEVQSLLNLGELEVIRKTLVKIQNTAKGELKSATQAVQKDQESIIATLELPMFDEIKILESINAIRSKLKANSISAVSSKIVRDGVTSQAVAGEAKVNPDILDKDIQTLTKILDNKDHDLEKTITSLRELVEDLCGDKNKLQEISKLQFLQSGLSLITEEGSCPFCDKPWPSGELKQHVLEHIDSAKQITGKKAQLDKLATDLVPHVTSYTNQIQNLIKAAKLLSLTEQEVLFTDIKTSLDQLTKLLSDPLKYFLDQQSFLDVTKILNKKDILSACGQVKDRAAKESPKITPEQTAWDTLTRLEENLKHWESTKNSLKQANLFFNRSEVLNKSFEEARDESLATLYSTIEARFSELYKMLHEHDDEGDFSSRIKPDGASLIFEVDFHGRGMFHPGAMHSEGHQDTMGLCLYLALVERLNGTLINLTILDDVVMSVDFNHRREVCHMINDKFPNRQFLITTHDRTWARQLTTTGVVKRENSLQFVNWHVNTGPVTKESANVWDKIKEDIDNRDINEAGAKLRYGAEQYFESICENLEAPIPYRSDGNYTLGEYAPAAVGAYKKFLALAKKSAQSWGDNTKVEKLEEMQTIAGQIIQRSQIEQWGINENVHFSKWGTFTLQDFQPVVEAWRDLFDLFSCPTCQTQLYLVKKGHSHSSMRCKCDATSFNLEEKPK